MRIVLAAMLLIAGVPLAGTASADPYRWCAQYGGFRSSTSNCYFLTLEQCRATISGVGGYCRPNPFYDGVPIDGPPRARAKKKQRDS